jgi:isoamylase
MQLTPSSETQGVSSRARRWSLSATLMIAAIAGGNPGSARADIVYPAGTPSLGAHYDKSGDSITFQVKSSRAKVIHLYLYDVAMDADERLVVPLSRGTDTDVWSASVPVADLKAKGITGTVYYGYRAWGPNWAFDEAWTKGTQTGFVTDLDDQGNRFNPNKLLIDPYAAELSHDPRNTTHNDGSVYITGLPNRTKDSGQFAPKCVVLMPDDADVGTRPTRAFREEIMYEVHVRGLTMLDPTVPEKEKGTYAGAARKADYLKDLGVTAVEFLPVHEFNNDFNDIDPKSPGNDYWGYDTLGFFAPDRRYSSDKRAGGPTREFKAMVKAFHDRGIKVYLDVVYNHTGEGDVQNRDGSVINLLSWHGLDNPAYNELTIANAFYYDNAGVDGNFNCANKVVRDQILDSLQYWSKVMGVDGFRFDLAAILGNTLAHQRPSDGQGFIYDKMPSENPLNRAVRELPVRPANGGPGVDLIAEPYTGDGRQDGQQEGNFPTGWAEWNPRYRDNLREEQNRLGFTNVTPGILANGFAGSSDLFQDNGRKPWHSVNSIVEHDGPTLHDLYAFNLAGNGGRRAWDQGGDKSLQRQAARDGFAFPLLSLGTPLFCGGDEFLRSIGGNDNPYNVDNGTNYLDWSLVSTNKNHFDFARRMIDFRRTHPALRPADYFDGKDHNGNGVKDITWFRDDGNEPDAGYFDAKDRHFLGYRIDGTEFGDPARSIYIGYNGWQDPVTITLPSPSPGHAWFRAGDTAAWMENDGNFREAGKEDKLADRTYGMDHRSVLVLIEK